MQNSKKAVSLFLCETALSFYKNDQGRFFMFVFALIETKCKKLYNIFKIFKTNRVNKRT